MMTYVRDDAGRMGADTDAFDDLLMPWMMCQQVGREIPLRTFTPARKAPARIPLSKVGGY